MNVKIYNNLQLLQQPCVFSIYARYTCSVFIQNLISIEENILYAHHTNSKHVTKLLDVRA